MPFIIEGMEAEIAKFEKLDAETEEKCRRAVKAGAAYLVGQLQEEVAVLDGHVHDSIKAGAVQYDAANGYHSRIELVGKDPVTGEPLAKIGNILEYGRSNMKAQPWFRKTIEREESATVAVMDEEFGRGG